MLLVHRVVVLAVVLVVSAPEPGLVVSVPELEPGLVVSVPGLELGLVASVPGLVPEPGLAPGPERVRGLPQRRQGAAVRLAEPGLQLKSDTYSSIFLPPLVTY